MTTSNGLINWLYKLAKDDDRRRLAALRRGLTLESAQWFELYRIVPPQFLDGIGRVEAERRLSVAMLFASHPLFISPEGRHHNLGASLRALAVKRQQRSGAAGEIELPETLKRRMDALLAANPEDLFAHIHHVIRLLKSDEVPVDWDQLLWDLRLWDRPDRRVQWQWSRSFYVGQREAEGGESDVS